MRQGLGRGAASVSDVVNQIREATIRASSSTPLTDRADTVLQAPDSKIGPGGDQARVPACRATPVGEPQVLRLMVKFRPCVW